MPSVKMRSYYSIACSCFYRLYAIMSQLVINLRVLLLSLAYGKEAPLYSPKFTIAGPGAPYTLLFDDDKQPGLSLAPAFQAIYAGDWRIPCYEDRPYVFTNFVCSHDGRIAFNLPDSTSVDISRKNPHDKWLMALLRARADAILIGRPTMDAIQRHRWTPDGVFPADREAFAELRRLEERSETPLVVILTASGELPAQARIFQEKQQAVMIATTQAGAERARKRLGEAEHIEYHVSSGDRVDLKQLVSDLFRHYHVRTLLSEAGSTSYAALLEANLIEEEFLTRSPIIVGNPAAPAPPRPSLIEGIAFRPEHPPELELLSLRRVGNFLFQRSRYRRNSE